MHDIEKTKTDEEPDEKLILQPSTPTPTEMPKSPAPHLTPRMVHPAMLQTSKLMNLGNAAQIFGSENFCSQVLSPKNLSRRSSLENTPTGPQEAQRPFSLAEAMQAARRLNLDQAQGSKDVSQEHSNSTQSELNLKPKFVMHNEQDAKSANSTQIEDSQLTKENAKESPVMNKEDEKSDLARNIEIRRL